MKTEVFYQMKAGDRLKLKSARQAAYGMESADVVFKELKHKEGYKTPWIVCECGIYKPSDFADWFPSI